ncbi:MAG TPA: carboxypeptidase regulatory-like domain-containing protein, partial [Pyrinomonadaceae bacterium]|nr:carboxypeptidase regulatory-like domain-containing protein [Pyrinomonadaceae bacterium]
PSQFDHALRAVREDYPPQATAAMLNLIDSHDTNRALYVLTEQNDSGLTQAKERLKLAALFQFTYIGAPMIYYGDEAGLNAPSLANGANGPEDDPYNRAPYPWADESGNANVYGPADNNLLAYYSQLAALRKQHAALRTGEFRPLLTGDTTASSTDNNTYAFARVSTGDKLIIALNNGDVTNTADIPITAAPDGLTIFFNGTVLQDVLNGGTYTVANYVVHVTIPPRSAVILAGPAGLTISGGVENEIGTPLPSVTITLNGTQSATTQTDAQGFFFINGLAPGSYTITPTRAGFTFIPLSQTLTNLSTDQSVLFIWRGAPVVSGHVTTSTGANLAGVTIIVRTDNNGTQTGQTDANGNYSVPYTPDSRVQITPVKTGFILDPVSVTYISPGGVITGNKTQDFTATSIPINLNSVQFSSANYPVGEGDARATVTVTLNAVIPGGAVVSYATVDNPAAVRCDDTQTLPGVAFARCDYATSVDTLYFSFGETSKTFTVPIIDDARVEPNESFTIRLLNPQGASLGGQSTATVTITDNDTPNKPNPVFTTPFFVRQHYLDFLAREPEQTEPWSNVLNNCADVNNTDPNAPSAGCDRITVSGAFFGSPEFLTKGVYVIVFYRVAFGRLPDYSEFAPDLRSVTGATAAETFAKRAEFANNFVQRQEFVNAYGALSNTAYVAQLLNRYGLTQITTPDPQQPDSTVKVTLTQTDLVNRLNAQTLTRAQVLRAIVQSDEVSLNREAVNAFVAAQYYGYLRRTPETGGFNSWVNYLTAHPTDFRTMVNGFMNSTEYRL